MTSVVGAICDVFNRRHHCEELLGRKDDFSSHFVDGSALITFWHIIGERVAVAEHFVLYQRLYQFSQLLRLFWLAFVYVFHVLKHKSADFAMHHFEPLSATLDNVPH